MDNPMRRIVIDKVTVNMGFGADEDGMKKGREILPALLRSNPTKNFSQYTNAKLFSKVLPFVHDGGPEGIRTINII